MAARVLITGASSGIGAALAGHYLDSGASVGVCGRDKERVDAVCGEYEGGRGLVFDTLDAEQTREEINRFIDERGGIDLAILNAGTHINTDAADFDPVKYSKIMQVNYVGTLNSLAPVIEQMKRQRGGTLAIMGSVAGYTGLANAGGYCASKAALIRLAQTMRTELEVFGIEVRLISPGFVKTPLTDKNDFPMPFLMEVDAAVERITTGLKGSRFEIAFPRRLAWGLRLLSLLPNWLYFRVAKTFLPDVRNV